MDASSVSTTDGALSGGGGIMGNALFPQNPEEAKIVELLNKRVGHKASAMEIARYLGFQTKKDANRVLYEMQKRGILRKVQESPPVWQLITRTLARGGMCTHQSRDYMYGANYRPLTPAELLRQEGFGVGVGMVNPVQPQWKRPRLESNPVQSNPGAIPSLLDIGVAMPPAPVTSYSAQKATANRNKGRGGESVSSILRSLNAHRRGGAAQPNAPGVAQYPSNAGFKPPPSPMEMIRATSTSTPTNQEAISVTTNEMVGSSSNIPASSTHAQHPPEVRGAPLGPPGGENTGSWVNTPTKPSWMRPQPVRPGDALIWISFWKLNLLCQRMNLSFRKSRPKNCSCWPLVVCCSNPDWECSVNYCLSNSSTREIP